MTMCWNLWDVQRKIFSWREQTVEDLMVIKYQHIDGHVYLWAAERKEWQEEEEDELQGDCFVLLGHG